MEAIVNIAGKQIRITPGKFVYVPLLKAKEGSKITFEEILLIKEGDKTQVGTPFIAGAKVTATVTAHAREKKTILVFHKKRRKGYKKMRGERPYYTRLDIETITQ